MARAAATAPGMVNGLFDRESTRVRTDEQLLQQFISRSDESAEAAFAPLVERYGPIVHRVCLNVLGNSHDTQDAAQAVFPRPGEEGPLHSKARVVGSLVTRRCRPRGATREECCRAAPRRRTEEGGNDA